MYSHQVIHVPIYTTLTLSLSHSTKQIIPQNTAFTEGMGGSSGMGSGERGPALPGMENLGADALMMGGIEENTEIPAGMEFVMSSVPDGEIAMDVASNSKGEFLCCWERY
jgi:hypothetical protein|eukprot:scaffold1630_cov228-Alexandrium_tamarense.AAC.12